MQQRIALLLSERTPAKRAIAVFHTAVIDGHIDLLSEATVCGL